MADLRAICECARTRSERSAVTGRRYRFARRCSGWAGAELRMVSCDKMRQELFPTFSSQAIEICNSTQHLPAAGVAVVVLRTGSTRLAETLPLMKEVLEQIESLRPGAVTIISNPS